MSGRRSHLIGFAVAPMSDRLAHFTVDAPGGIRTCLHIGTAAVATRFNRDRTLYRPIWISLVDQGHVLIGPAV